MTVDEIRLIGDRVLVRPDPKVDQSEGGIQIPETVLADNPNFYYVTGTVMKLGDGVRDSVYECANQQCRYQSRRTAGEYCPVCKATQVLVAHGERRPFAVQVGDRVHFGRFAGKQVDMELLAETKPLGTDSEGFTWKCLEHARTKMLIMREVEIAGIVTGDERVVPGYEAARWNKPTAGLTPVVTT